LLNEREVVAISMAAFPLGSELRADVGAASFFAVLGAGPAVVLGCTLVAWRLGEKVFSWQEKSG
jgi:hypothetical protein